MVWSRGRGSMGSILKAIGAIIGLSILLLLLGNPVLGTDTKTAYTRDGINFISKERMDENIKYEYAKPGEYREVQVPLNTIVVNASVIPQSVSDQVKQDTKEPEGIQPPEPPEKCSCIRRRRCGKISVCISGYWAAIDCRFSHLYSMGYQRTKSATKIESSAIAECRPQ